jgi:hypothetical protein
MNAAPNLPATAKPHMRLIGSLPPRVRHAVFPRSRSIQANDRHLLSIVRSAAVEEQGAATQEIARNVQNAASGTTEVANNIGAVNKGAGETGFASAQVLASAQSLSADSNRLKTEVDRFLTTVRAA